MSTVSPTAAPQLRRTGRGAKTKRGWITALFGLPFAAFGLGMLFLSVIPNLHDAWRMQFWEHRQAQLLSAELAGNDGTSRAEATYRYSYQGLQFTGDRVAIIEWSDNIGPFQQRLGSQLEQAFQQGRAVDVWIDPDDPQKAVLNRELRWGMIGFKMIFVVIFGGIGLGIIWAGLRAKGNTIAHPKGADKPWLTRKEWASPVISSDAKAGMWAICIFAGFWNLIAFPIGILAFGDVLDGNPKALVALIFPVVGIGLLSWAVKLVRAYRRFGRAPLTMDPYPGSTGGQVGGSIDVGLSYDPNIMFRTTLSCLYSYESGSGKNRRRSERVVWQSEGYAHTRRHGDKTRLEVLFEVDDGLPASDPQDSSSYHLWRINVHASLPGPDFDRSYEIPVFPTTAKAEQVRTLSTEHSSAAEDRIQSIEEVLNLKQVPGGVEIYYPAFRHPGGKIAGIIGGLFFVTVGLLAAADGAPIVFPIVFPLLGGLIAFASAYSLLVSLRVRLDENSLTTEKHLLGMRVGGNRIFRSDVRSLGIKRGASASTGNKHTVYFTLQAHTHSGNSVDIGMNLAGRDVALQAAESIGMLTGLPVEEKSAKQGGVAV